jgi:hypothetical protein
MVILLRALFQNGITLSQIFIGRKDAWLTIMTLDRNAESAFVLSLWASENAASE